MAIAIAIGWRTHERVADDTKGLWAQGDPEQHLVRTSTVRVSSASLYLLVV
jgi:hypothetical protein